MLLKVSKLVLQKEEALLPRNGLRESSVPAGPDREAISAGMLSWRTFLQWELTRVFVRLRPHESRCA